MMAYLCNRNYQWFNVLQHCEQATGPDMCQRAAEAAIAAGYRHIDTAYSYRNETEVGKAIQSKIQQGIIRRQDMFIVSKVSSSSCWGSKVKSM